LVNPADSLRVLIARFLESPADDRPAVGRALFDLLDHDVQQWWIHCHPDGTPHAQGPAYEAYRQEVFNDLMTALSVMTRIDAFPFALIAALDRVLLDKLQSGEGALPSPQPSKLRRTRTSRCKTTFTNRILVYWYADRLPLRMRQALELKFVHGLNYAGIVRIMGGTRSGAESNLIRGVGHIRLYADKDRRGLRPKRTKR
jgi:hypothetical protein